MGGTKHYHNCAGRQIPLYEKFKIDMPVTVGLNTVKHVIMLQYTIVCCCL